MVIIPEKYFKHLDGSKGLYEIRVQSGSNIYRIFAFFDKGNVIVIGNAFQKKSEIILKREIDKAIQIMKEYFNEKK